MGAGAKGVACRSRASDGPARQWLTDKVILIRVWDSLKKRGLEGVDNGGTNNDVVAKAIQNDCHTGWMHKAKRRVRCFFYAKQPAGNLKLTIERVANTLPIARFEQPIRASLGAKI